MKKIAFILAALSLSGCVTPTPMATEQQYNSYAGIFSLIRDCSLHNEMPMSLAAAGMNMMQSQQGVLANFDQVKLISKIQYYSKPEQLAEVKRQTSCNQVALEITQRQQQIAAHNAAVQQFNQAAQNFANSTPKTTFCNNYGTMTTCNTY